MTVCSIEDCGSVVKARGFCNRHYLRYLNQGGEKKKVLFGPAEERFHQLYTIDEATGCWKWTGFATKKGHPVIGIGYKTFSANQFSYALRHGPVPKGKLVWRHCDTPACVNPDHLSIVKPAPFIEPSRKAVGRAYIPRLRKSSDMLATERALRKAEGKRVAEQARRELIAIATENGLVDGGDTDDANEDYAGSVCVLLPKGEFAIIDTVLLDWFLRYRWFVYHVSRNRSQPHVVGSIGGKTFRFSRLLTGCPDGMLVDHWNHQPRDNRLRNLRIATGTQNNANQRKLKARSSIHKGVHWNTAAGRWVAALGVNKRRIYLGRFDTEDEAARAYNRAALEHFGDFAHLNSVGSFTGT